MLGAATATTLQSNRTATGRGQRPLSLILSTIQNTERMTTQDNKCLANRNERHTRLGKQGTIKAQRDKMLLADFNKLLAVPTYILKLGDKYRLLSEAYDLTAGRVQEIIRQDRERKKTNNQQLASI